jgi:hypothetical protein
MGLFLALMLSNIYGSNFVDKLGASATRVDGGIMVTTVGLGKRSQLYCWLILALLPPFTLITALCLPLDYIPLIMS